MVHFDSIKEGFIMKNVLSKSIFQIIQGAVKTFSTFPAAIGSASGFAVVTMIRIQLDWPQQEPYNFLFNCLHWSLALGAVFSLAAITAARSRYAGEKAFRLANIISIAVAAVTFLLLYFFSASHTDLNNSSYVNISGIAASRVGVAMMVSIIAFVIMAAWPKEQSDFARSLFMTEKAFFIALIYGAVLMAGTSAVAGAFKALIYRNMSYKVYEYLGTIVGFLAFTIFVGYFPDFRKGQTDEKREAAQKQPRFIEILFEYIMIPIMLALTAVLLVWAAKTMLSGEKLPFEELAGIATSFAVSGIWLHIMVTGRQSGLARFYRKFYPFAALLILAFEAWALVVQLGKYGMKDTEYIFMLLWIIAAASSVLLIVMKQKSHMTIAVIACALAVFSVLPAVGYNVLPVTSQVSRLEKLLESQGMLQNGRIVTAKTELDKAVREGITDSVSYLAYARDAKLPAWFDRKLSESDTFKEKFGFDQTWPETPGGKVQYPGTSLNLQNGAADISGYRWALYMQNPNESGKSSASAAIKGDRGTYTITWITDQTNGLPTFRIRLNDKVILEQSMKSYVDRIRAKYPPGQQTSTEGTLDDMSVKLETPEVSIMIVFNNVQINVDNQQGTVSYWLNLNGIYIKEK
jgi:hypothetical protein